MFELDLQEVSRVVCLIWVWDEETVVILQGQPLTQPVEYTIIELGSRVAFGRTRLDTKKDVAIGLVILWPKPLLEGLDVTEAFNYGIQVLF
jgi:hypothetical protein